MPNFGTGGGGGDTGDNDFFQDETDDVEHDGVDLAGLDDEGIVGIRRDEDVDIRAAADYDYSDAVIFEDL